MDYSHFLDRLSADRRRELQARLTEVVLPRRLVRMDEVLERRSRNLTVLFEDLYHPHNASAVIRTAECFGVQDIHVVEGEHRFRPARDVVRGAGRWVTLHRHADLDAALADLRSRGYLVAATAADATSVPLARVPVDRPLVLCFGTEEVGLSDAALARADLHVHVPMVGFTESLNVSVTAALVLHELADKLRRRDDWGLPPAEKDDLRLTWLMQEGQKTRALTVRLLREWGLVESSSGTKRG